MSAISIENLMASVRALDMSVMNIVNSRNVILFNL